MSLVVCLLFGPRRCFPFAAYVWYGMVCPLCLFVCLLPWVSGEKNLDCFFLAISSSCYNTYPFFFFSLLLPFISCLFSTVPVVGNGYVLFWGRGVYGGLELVLLYNIRLSSLGWIAECRVLILCFYFSVLRLVLLGGDSDTGVVTYGLILALSSVGCGLYILPVLCNRFSPYCTLFGLPLGFFETNTVHGTYL